MEAAPLDAEELIRALARHDVDYVVIGGLAVQAHGHPRTTQDLDLIPRPNRANYRRLAQALDDLGARPLELPAPAEPTAADPEQLATAAIVPPLATRHGSIHVMNDVAGAAPYEQLRSRALTIEVAGTSVAVAGLDDLISMKRASGRARDLKDIAALTTPSES